jgi:hypothetical protein
MDCIDEIWQWATTETNNTSSIHRFSIMHAPNIGLGTIESSSGSLVLVHGPVDQTGNQTFTWVGEGAFPSDPWNPFQISIDSYGNIFTQYTGGLWKGGPWMLAVDGCDNSAGKLRVYGVENPLASGLVAPNGGWIGTEVSLWSFSFWQIEIGKKVFEALRGTRSQRK